MSNVLAVIMGAAVSAEGAPSNAMRRRVDGALKLQDEFKEIIFVTTGGVGRGKGYSEAEVMRDLLIEAGIRVGRIKAEVYSKNTLQSVLNCVRIIRNLANQNIVVVCSDTYHIARCRILFFLSGIRTIYRPMPNGRQANGWVRWIYFYLREFFAIPVDALILIARRMINRN